MISANGKHLTLAPAPAPAISTQPIASKVAIITGSSRGIGKALALHMSRQGYQVVLNGRNEGRLSATQSHFRQKNFEPLAVPGDVSKQADCRNLIETTLETYGKIDILVNNAGLTMKGSLEDTTPEVFAKVMNVNYLGSVYPTQVALPHLRKSKGSVLFISSLAAIHGLPNFSAYCASKTAIRALAESLKIELRGTGVHVGLACVGFTKNDPKKTIYNAAGDLEKMPKRTDVKTEPVEKVAAQLLRMIERRTHKKTFTRLGFLLSCLNRLSPALVEQALKYIFERRK